VYQRKLDPLFWKTFAWASLYIKLWTNTNFELRRWWKTMETSQGIFFYVSRTLVTWQESLQKKPTRKMKMMQKVFKCGSLKIGKRFSSTKNLVFKLKETCMVVTCLSQLAYKLSGKRRWCYVMDMKVVCVFMLRLEQMTKR